MRQLTDYLLVDVYQRAISLNLDPDFIELLSVEIKRRKLHESLAHSIG
ncbi:sporulation histidine kinase inhibitor Sda [Brevibacillus ginsengisoli]